MISLLNGRDVRLTKHFQQVLCEDNLTKYGLDYLTMKSDRIRDTRKSKKLTQQRLGDLVGVTKTTISQWEKGDYSPSGQNLYNLAKALGVSAEWLLSGKGTPDFQNVEPAVLGNHKVPVLSYIQAGMWAEPCEVRDFEGNIEFITTFNDVGPRTFAIWIKGRSMEPLFDEGDLIVCDPDITPHPGDYVIAKNGSEEATFKKYRPRGYKADGSEIFELVPLNEDYPTLSSETCPIRIVATMVEHRKYRKRR